MMRFDRGCLLMAGLLALAPASRAAETPAAPAPASPAPAAAAPGIMGVGLAITDADRAVRFYRDGLGLTELRRLQAADALEIIMATGAGSPPILLVKSAGASPAPAMGERQDKLILSVTDAAALAARLTAAGYAPGPVRENKAHGVKLFWVSDPDGHRFEVTERVARAK